MSLTVELPAKQTAFIGVGDGTLTLSTDFDVPVLQDDMVIVRNRAIGLNPVDTKMKGDLAAAGAVAGIDFCGEVLAIGRNFASPAQLRVGDRVCGAVTGYQTTKPTSGAFAEIVGATDCGLLRIPDNWSFEQGASFGVAIGTMGLALFTSLKVPGTPKTPVETPVDVFVYGGSTTTGTLALQLLKLSGLKTTTVCSPHNFDLVKSYGADTVFDYKSPTVIEDIRNHTRKSLKFVLDCISDPGSMEFCYKVLGRTGGSYCAIEPFPDFLHTRPRTVKPDWVFGPTSVGEAIDWAPPFHYDVNPELRVWGVDWYITVQKLLDEGKLKPHPVRVIEGGFDGVMKGLELLKKKQVSGCKLVCSLA